MLGYIWSLGNLTTNGLNMRLNTLCIFGTRPEAIKMAPIIKQLETHHHFNNKICVTGQHQQMLKSVLDLFEIIPDFNLEVMEINQDLSKLTAKILVRLAEMFKHYQPHLVLVHGDTTTTLAATLSAYYHHIPVAHIEAGLRTGNINSPWPEEANRKLAGALAAVHFAPTTNSRLNLLREGVPKETIFVTGNTVIDALLEMNNKIEREPGLYRKLRESFPFLSQHRKMLLVTGHRRENFGQGFKRICQALVEISQQFPDVDIVYPVHLNPNVQQKVNPMLKDIQTIYLIPPVDYLQFVYLMKTAYLILTDSGGIQEEAPALGKPVLVMREATERPEAIAAGTAKLVGTNVGKILHHVRELLMDVDCYQQMSGAKNPYGNGTASKQIIQIISEQLVGEATMSNLKPANTYMDEILS